jgi:protein-tyrosine phosphatase
LFIYVLEHILNVCDWGTKQIIQDNFNVVHIPMADEPETDIKQVRSEIFFNSFYRFSLQHFDRTNELLHGFYEKNERCLVHCAAGKYSY